MAQRKGLLRQIFSNFINSLKPKKHWGELQGTDYMGTDYYEGPKISHGGRRRRWFVPTEPDNFEQELPPEWVAWLTHKRKEPPTEEEINLNLQKMKITIENAKKLEKSKTKSGYKISNCKKLEQSTQFEESDSKIRTNKKETISSSF